MEIDTAPAPSAHDASYDMMETSMDMMETSMDMMDTSMQYDMMEIGMEPHLTVRKTRMAATTATTASAHTSTFVCDMMGDAAVFDRNYNHMDDTEEDAIERALLSGEARFTMSGKVPSSIQAILRGRVARLLNEEDHSPRDALSAASTNGHNTPTTTSCKNDDASWLDHADPMERFIAASAFESPIRAVPKNKADFSMLIADVRDVTEDHESQDDAPEMH